jgi:hypothetical protein
MPRVRRLTQTGSGQLLRVLFVQRSSLWLRARATHDAHYFVTSLIAMHVVGTGASAGVCRRFLLRGVVAAFMLFVGLSDSHAQDRLSQTPPEPVRVGALDLTLNWRSRAEYWNWFQGDAGSGRYGFGHSQLRVGIGQQRERLNWLIEGEQVAILGLPADAVAPPPLGQLGLGGTYYAANDNHVNNASAFVKQSFVQWKSLGPTSLKVGRFEFFDGAEARSSDAAVTTLVQTRIAHRLISNFGFTAVQRTFDGAQFAWTSGTHNVTALAARPTEGIFQVDGMGELNVQIYYGAYNRSISSRQGAGSFRAFAVGYVDSRSGALKTDNRSTAARTADRSDIRVETWGADYVHVFRTASAGAFDLLGWGAIQTGNWGTLTHRAGAVVGEGGWQVPARLSPFLSAGYSYGSGDGDPADGRHGTFFQLLTTPRQYARFPFYNMMNNEDAYATLNVRLSPHLAVRSELHRLWLARATDLWYSGGGAFQQSTFGYQGRPSGGRRNLATVWDVSGDYQLTRVLTITLYYAHASADDVIAGIYGRENPGTLAYAETTVHF